jgi:Flp pilus assembly protein TadG
MFRRFLFDQRGNLSVTLTLAMVPLMAAVAGAVDVSGTLNDAERLQNALDATAFAVATAYDAEMTDAELIAVAKNHFVGNLETLQYDASVFGKLASGPNPTGDGVRVTTSVSGITEVRVQANIKHEGFLGANYWKPFRKSIVQTQEGSITCFLALDKYASAAIDIQGSTDIELHKCVMAANSNSTSAIYRNGSAQLDAQCAYAVGETSGLVNSSSVNLECGDPLEHRLPVIDTLASVPLPADTVCQTVPNRKTKTLVPGTYCGDRISGEVTLDPGTYVLNGGSVDLGGNGYLVGYGVTIFLRNNAKFTINGNEGVVLTPPNSGPYAGITIYQERANTNAVKINGTSGSTIDGFVYAPGAQVTYNGNAGASTLGKCLRVVGDTIVLTGNSTVKSDCSAELGDREVSSGRATALVE